VSFLIQHPKLLHLDVGLMPLQIPILLDVDYQPEVREIKVNNCVTDPTFFLQFKKLESIEFVSSQGPKIPEIPPWIHSLKIDLGQQP
jgi:hypothetical protein